jgi:hypothetical protein
MGCAEGRLSKPRHIGRFSFSRPQNSQNHIFTARSIGTDRIARRSIARAREGDSEGGGGGRGTAMLRQTLLLLGSAPVVVGSCANFVEFNSAIGLVNAECCDEPSEDCSSGYPATCNSGCATVLLRMQNECGEFLSDTAAMKPVKAAIDVAAATCSVRHCSPRLRVLLMLSPAALSSSFPLRTPMCATLIRLS